MSPYRPDGQLPDDEKIDEALKESFPASDPPFWTLGVEPESLRAREARPPDRQPEEEPRWSTPRFRIPQRTR